MGTRPTSQRYVGKRLAPKLIIRYKCPGCKVLVDLDVYEGAPHHPQCEGDPFLIPQIIVRTPEEGMAIYDPDLPNGQTA
jgi:hypothetical protein